MAIAQAQRIREDRELIAWFMKAEGRGQRAEGKMTSSSRLY
jgi:hypothetical protein